MDNNRILEEVLKAAKEKISEHEVDTWLKPLKIIELRGDLIVLAAPNIFAKKWVEEKYTALLKTIFNDYLSIEASNIKIISEKTNQTKDRELDKAPSVPSPVSYINNLAKNNLNKEYTFESFVEGNSNQFAYAAAMAIADGNFNVYNPFFIYGGVGLGKTHIMHAIGNKILQKFPKLNVMYISSENWTNELIQALRLKKMEDFKIKYRSIDVLLFDDVQFIIGKTRTTEEFFHTFNSLYDMQKQIIITSDKTPDEMPDMEERLTSRFAWGLIADIQPPSVEEKTAILIKKASQMKIDLPDEVALFISENIKSENIRELLGAFTRLSAYASFSNEPITIKLAEKTLERFLKKQHSILTSEVILSTIVDFFNISENDLKSKKRSKSISYPRQICMYLLKDKLNISLKEIGDIFGGRDHSTVIHSIKSIEEKIKTDGELKETLEMINKKLLK
jgi:chromosomal replication initiator protein